MKKFILNNLQDSKNNSFKNQKQYCQIQNDNSWQHAGIYNAVLLLYEMLHMTNIFSVCDAKITWSGYDIQ